MPDLAAAISPHLNADPRPSAAPGDRLAAVLALIVQNAPAGILLTERSASMSRHPGQVAFPGGLQDPEDPDLRTTALRELHEELGLEAEGIDVVGALPPVHTHVSATLVTPFVGLTEALAPLVVNPGEIARALVVPIADLVGAEALRERTEPDGTTWRGWWYELPELTVWGATGMMLHALLELFRREAAWMLH